MEQVKKDRPDVKMIASDQPDHQMMSIQKAEELLAYERERGLKLWSIAEDDPNYSITADGKIITKSGK